MVDGRWYLAGITSFGSGCAKPGYPDVYTRLSFYLPWIRNKLKQQWELGLIALLFVFLNSKSATETCHCPFLQCLITCVCDFEHKLKICIVDVISLFVCSKSDTNMMQKILSLGEQCRSDWRMTVPLSADWEGLLHCLTLMMAVLSSGTLGTADWTAHSDNARTVL